MPGLFSTSRPGSHLAQRAFDFIAQAMTRGDRLGHSWRAGKLKFPGLASDFAAMIRAALALYEATGERAYLEQALAWQHALDATTPMPRPAAIISPRPTPKDWCIRPAATTDEATPNPNAVAAQNLVRLAVLAGDDRWREQGRPADRRHRAGRRRTIFTCTWRCSMPSICGCARPRSW